MASKKSPDTLRQMGLFDKSDTGKDIALSTGCEFLLQNLRQPDVIPTELRIVKDLTSRVFASSDARNSAQDARSMRPGTLLYCASYPVGGPLITRCDYHYEAKVLAIRYRMGFTDSYLNIGKHTVADFWEAKQETRYLYEQQTRFLYENIITAHTPLFRPAQFDQRPERSPSENMVFSSLETIAPHVPTNFRPYFEKWLRLKSILIKVVPSRKTKHGDYRRRRDGEHVITLNETDNQLAFTLTLLHELSHAFAPRTRSCKPHDRHWKLTFSNMLIDAIELFPERLWQYIAFVSCNPSASKDICEDYMLDDYLEKNTSTDLTLGEMGSLRDVLKLEQKLGVNLDRFKP